MVGYRLICILLTGLAAPAPAADPESNPVIRIERWIEGGARVVPEEEMLEALVLAQEAVAPVLDTRPIPEVQLLLLADGPYSPASEGWNTVTEV